MFDWNLSGADVTASLSVGGLRRTAALSGDRTNSTWYIISYSSLQRAHGVVGYHIRLAFCVCGGCWVQFPVCPIFFIIRDNPDFAEAVTPGSLKASSRQLQKLLSIYRSVLFS